MAKILVVEDDATNLEIASRFLRLRGYDVVSAHDGPSAVAQALAEKPDLILMDMKLPHAGDGQAATRAIRAQPSLGSVPIIALTAQAMPVEIDDMFAAGCDDVETKPFNFAQLHGKIEKLLAARSQR
ncbi:MAG: response regulator [Gemmataceae bacterium]|nr:response regulator [Gemmataceae bacterium]MDW8263933.1 response regulator [Gemmataceae bacterium]